MKKKLVNLLLFIFTLLVSFNSSYANNEIPDYDRNYYIDELNILSNKTKERINYVNNNFDDGTEVFVLTKNNLTDDPQDYAVRAFKAYNLGSKENQNGLLILLAKTPEGKHEIRVITGYGLEPILPDGKVGRIIDEYMMPYFLNNDLDNGILNGFNALINVIEENKIYTENPSEEYTDSGRGFFKASIFFSLCIFLLGTLLVLIEKHKYKKYIKIKKEIENMTYNEVLNNYSKNNTEEIDDLYKNRLNYLAIDKSIDEIKIDKDKFNNNRKIFNTYEEILLDKQKQYISSLSEEELNYQYRNTNSPTEKNYMKMKYMKEINYMLKI